MYATFSNFPTGKLGPTLGPFSYFVITYNTFRAGDSRGDAEQFAYFDWVNGTWRLDSDDSEWTDITIHNDRENALRG